ncbi:MAG: hypothetical protein E2O56_02400 [Gammaproteobacteria bacterium]|nr:MAG: hypothetical protein E2O56_02400 [Gammaproteobacteria bacterium]
MSYALLGLLMMVAGAGLVLVSLLADMIGYGSDVNTFGWLQFLLLLVGAGTAAGGWFLYHRE